MNTIDTSPEAVERAAGRLDVAAYAAWNVAGEGPRGDAPPPEESWYGQAARLLGALAAERDAERAKVARLRETLLMAEKYIFDEAERRDYAPPVPGDLVADIATALAETAP